MKGNRGNRTKNRHKLSEAEQQKGREARRPGTLRAMQRKGGRATAARKKAEGSPAFFPDEAARGRRAGGEATKKKGPAYYARIQALAAEARRTNNAARRRERLARDLLAEYEGDVEAAVAHLRQVHAAPPEPAAG